MNLSPKSNEICASSAFNWAILKVPILSFTVENIALCCKLTTLSISSTFLSNCISFTMFNSPSPSIIPACTASSAVSIFIEPILFMENTSNCVPPIPKFPLLCSFNVLLPKTVLPFMLPLIVPENFSSIFIFVKYMSSISSISIYAQPSGVSFSTMELAPERTEFHSEIISPLICAPSKILISSTWALSAI